MFVELSGFGSDFYAEITDSQLNNIPLAHPVCVYVLNFLLDRHFFNNYDINSSETTRNLSKPVKILIFHGLYCKIMSLQNENISEVPEKEVHNSLPKVSFSDYICHESF